MKLDTGHIDKGFEALPAVKKLALILNAAIRISYAKYRSGEAENP